MHLVKATQEGPESFINIDINFKEFIDFIILYTESEKKSGRTLKNRLDEAVNEKLAEVERKRTKMILLDQKIKKLGDTPERRKLMFQKTQIENYNRKHKKSPIDEERALHESFQIILKVSEVKTLVYKYMSQPKPLVLKHPPRIFTRTIEHPVISGRRIKETTKRKKGEVRKFHG